MGFAGERETRRASSQLRRGMSVPDLFRIAQEAAESSNSWVVGVRECQNTSNSLSIRASKSGGYQMVAIRNWKTRAEEAWRMTLPSMEALLAQVTASTGGSCRAATMWFDGRWVIEITLDSEGHVEEVAPARLAND